MDKLKCGDKLIFAFPDAAEVDPIDRAHAKRNLKVGGIYTFYFQDGNDVSIFEMEGVAFPLGLFNKHASCCDRCNEAVVMYRRKFMADSR